MPSWQSYALDLVLRLQVKRRLRKVVSAQAARDTFEGSSLPLPKGAKCTPDKVGGIPGEWVESGGVPVATLLYLHGGGYLACSSVTHRALTGAFAIRGFRVFAADYRLAPENPFPAAVDDGLAVYKALLDSGISPSRLVIGGDSAGGGLTLATLLAAKAAGLPMPAAAVVFSPWTDLAGTGDSLKSNLKRDSMLIGDRIRETAGFYLNGANPENPLASPLYGDLAGLPPLFMQVGESEVLRDDSTRFASRASAAGVPVNIKVWAGMPHVWQLFQPFLPEARAAVDEASAFVKAHLGG